MQTPDRPPPPPRLASIDAYRGFVMFLMMAEVLHLKAVAKALKTNDVWNLLSHHQEHVEWIGCTLHDLIQPSFSFLVGVALPFSIASRIARGQSWPWMTLHALWRALVLVALGIFLRSIGQKQTNFTFEDTLTQIGLGYGFLFVLGLRPARDQWIAFALIVIGYWAAFALTPLPGSDFEFAEVGVPEDWPHLMTGFAAHWNKNSNLAWSFDRWFLNLFPRSKPFAFNAGGYATLSFIPTLGTMILGLIAGGVLRGERSGPGKVAWLAAAGLVGLAAGAAIGVSGLCPVVKRIWTPSWVLYSGGWCFLMLATSYLATDLSGWKGWALPLIVIGMNSIAAYCMSGLLKRFIAENLLVHLGRAPFQVLGPAYEPLLQGAAVLLVLWLILAWMYRRGVFLRI
jgi:heparan-alpha-glucosaminide N-acetyltransferase